MATKGSNGGKGDATKKQSPRKPSHQQINKVSKQNAASGKPSATPPRQSGRTKS